MSKKPKPHDPNRLNVSMVPRYPIYIPSRGRYETPYTAKLFAADGLDFKLVVEPQEQRQYEDLYGAERVLVLPENNQGLIYARNWIKAHATAAGAERHWQFDDNIQYAYMSWNAVRHQCQPRICIVVCEDFTDRYERVAVSGLEYYMMGDQRHARPFVVNGKVYSMSLVNNQSPFSWRQRYNDDVDLCLQAVTNGWYTILLRNVLMHKLQTMTVKGGNFTGHKDEKTGKGIYEGDGRLKMARSLERIWPHVVSVNRRFNRPQHVVRDYWKKFARELELKPNVDLEKLAGQTYPLAFESGQVLVK